MADVSKVNVNSIDYNIKDSNAMHKGVDRVTAGQLSGSTLGTRATAEGYDITASGLNSHGEGSGTTAEGENSHAEGNWTFATGFASHTEGEATHATQSYSHAEGYYSTASGNSSHAEGYYNTASGNYSHAEGFYSTASGNSSHAEGYQTKASSAYQHVEGKYNVEDSNSAYAHIIGGGTANSARKNIFTVDWNGVARDGTENRLLPFKAVSEAEYAALSQAEKTNGTAYFRYEANGIMREIQDNGSATSLTSGALPTGQTITSYLNSNLGWTQLGKVTNDGGTITVDDITVYKEYLFVMMVQGAYPVESITLPQALVTNTSYVNAYQDSTHYSLTSFSYNSSTKKFTFTRQNIAGWNSFQVALYAR